MLVLSLVHVITEIHVHRTLYLTYNLCLQRRLQVDKSAMQQIERSERKMQHDDFNESGQTRTAYFDLHRGELKSRERHLTIL